MPRDRDLHDMHDYDEPEREITLGTSTVLGLFLVLALICAGFFGFGYSMGRRSAQTAALNSSVADSKDDGDSKSSSSADTGSSTSDAPVPVSSPAAPATTKEVVLHESDQPTASPAPRTAIAPPPAPAATHPAPPPVAAVPTHEPAPTATITQGPVVQISAPSRQGDADALLAALHKKGYTAHIRREPQDNFFHVQIGPFENRKDAEAMRKRLDADGYKPFIK